MCQKAVIESIENGFHAIVDNTNIIAEHRTIYKKIAKLLHVDLVVFNVFDQFGIGEAQVEKIKGEWPKRILVRCHFSGLEGFTLILKDMTYKKNTLKCRMCDPKGKELKGKYLLNNEGGVSKKIPGYFEIEIPTKIISDSDRFKLKWIDFYR